jgi:enoyl-CoA hydratase
MSYKTIIFEESDNIATITLNRPDALNAINQDMREDFERVLDEIQSNDRIRVIVFTGLDSKAFYWTKA